MLEDRTSWAVCLLAACTPQLQLDVVVTSGEHHVLEKHLSLQASVQRPVELICTSSEDPGEVHVVRGVSDQPLQLQGLLADTRYSCTIGEPDRAVAWSGEVHTDPLPDDMAVLVPSGDPLRSEIAGGYLVLNHWRQGVDVPKVQWALVVDGKGRIRWYRELPEANTGGVTVRVSGEHVLAGGGKGMPPALFDLSGEVVFQVPLAPLDLNHHHEAAFTDEGHVVSLADSPLQLQGRNVKGFRIEAVDPATGQITWSYETQEGAALGDYDWVEVDDLDPLHANAVVWLDDALGPAVWVSCRGQSVILRIDRRTKRLSWRMGGARGEFDAVDEAGAVLHPEELFFAQHGPQLDGDRLRLFDNGVQRSDGLYSRAVEYELDMAARTLRPVWEWTEPDLHEPFYGNVTGLPGGNRLVASGHCNHCASSGGESRAGFLAEIDEAGEVLYRLDFADFSHSLFRAEAVDGCVLFANQALCGEEPQAR
ncbi:MAG: aryl-sulfate sulfotransferase [Myxococcales bacterium]|nr:aryl-sulfate sulfotransferase [Myxococcales bacterium]